MDNTTILLRKLMETTINEKMDNIDEWLKTPNPTKIKDILVFFIERENNTDNSQIEEEINDLNELLKLVEILKISPIPSIYEGEYDYQLDGENIGIGLSKRELKIIVAKIPQQKVYFEYEDRELLLSEYLNI